jgi:hypothetical protein
MTRNSGSSFPSAAEEAPQLVTIGPFQPELFIRLEELVLPTRAYNCFDSAGLEFVGDLVRLSRSELFNLPNLGRNTVRDIESQLQELGLALGMSLINWELVNHELAAAEYKIGIHDLHRRPPPRPWLVEPSATPEVDPISEEVAAASVEEEVDLLLSRALKPRDLTVLAARIAWREEESPTLQVIGNAFQISRERVRQIVADSRRKAARRKLEAPLTRRCLDRVTEILPSELSKVEAILVEEGFILAGTRLRAVMTAARALGVECDFAVEKTPSSTLVLSKAAKLTSPVASPVTRKNPVRREWGHSQQDDVWVEYAVSKASISNGVFSFPANVEQTANGDFRVEDAAGVRLTTLRVKNGLAWGFRPYFLRCGIEPGDIIRVTFRLATMKASIELTNT